MLPKWIPPHIYSLAGNVTGEKNKNVHESTVKVGYNEIQGEWEFISL